MRKLLTIGVLAAAAAVLPAMPAVAAPAGGPYMARYFYDGGFDSKAACDAEGNYMVNSDQSPGESCSVNSSTGLWDLYLYAYGDV